VVQELLDFDGDEIYFEECPEAGGHSFAEVILAYPTSTIIGRRAADGTIEVCPPMDTRFSAGDQVIAVSEDDDTVVFGGFTPVAALDGVGHGTVEPEVEHYLIVGWNALGPQILRELDQFVAPGSHAEVLVDASLVDPDRVAVAGLLHVDVHCTATEDEAEELPKLAATNAYSGVIILGYKRALRAAEADARSLLAMLLIQRGLADAEHEREPRVIVELLDAKDAELAQVSGADDFVVSDALASLMMSQLSEHPELAEVYRQIYTAEGSSLRMEAADAYVGSGEVEFGQVVATAAAHDRLAIGWRRVIDGAAEVVVNPRKDRRVSFGPDDYIVIIG